MNMISLNIFHIYKKIFYKFFLFLFYNFLFMRNIHLINHFRKTTHAKICLDSSSARMAKTLPRQLFTELDIFQHLPSNSKCHLENLVFRNLFLCDLLHFLWLLLDLLFPLSHLLSWYNLHRSGVRYLYLRLFLGVHFSLLSSLPNQKTFSAQTALSLSLVFSV